MIYALICECLFLPGDHMGPRLHIIFVFAFPSLPPTPKMVLIFIKAIYSCGCQRLIGFGIRSDKSCLVILEGGLCLRGGK